MRTKLSHAASWAITSASLILATILLVHADIPWITASAETPETAATAEAAAQDVWIRCLTGPEIYIPPPGNGARTLVVNATNNTDTWRSCTVKCQYKRRSDGSRLTFECSGAVPPKLIQQHSLFCAKTLALKDFVEAGATGKRASCTKI